MIRRHFNEYGGIYAWTMPVWFPMLVVTIAVTTDRPVCIGVVQSVSGSGQGYIVTTGDGRVHTTQSVGGLTVGKPAYRGIMGINGGDE